MARRDDSFMSRSGLSNVHRNACDVRNVLPWT